MALARFIVVVENDKGRVVEELPRICELGVPAPTDRVQISGETCAGLYVVNRRLFVDDERQGRKIFMMPKVFVRRLWSGGGGDGPKPDMVDPVVSLKPPAGKSTEAAVIPIREMSSELALQHHVEALGADAQQVTLLRLLRQQIDFYNEQRDQLAELVRVDPRLFIENHSPERLRQLSRETKREFTRLCLELGARQYAVSAPQSAA